MKTILLKRPHRCFFFSLSLTLISHLHCFFVAGAAWNEKWAASSWNRSHIDCFVLRQHDFTIECKFQCVFILVFLDFRVLCVAIVHGFSYACICVCYLLVCIVAFCTIDCASSVQSIDFGWNMAVNTIFSRFELIFSIRSVPCHSRSHITSNNDFIPFICNSMHSFQFVPIRFVFFFLLFFFFVRFVHSHHKRYLSYWFLMCDCFVLGVAAIFLAFIYSFVSFFLLCCIFVIDNFSLALSPTLAPNRILYQTASLALTSAFKLEVDVCLHRHTRRVRCWCTMYIRRWRKCECTREFIVASFFFFLSFLFSLPMHVIYVFVLFSFAAFVHWTRKLADVTNEYIRERNAKRQSERERERDWCTYTHKCIWIQAHHTQWISVCRSFPLFRMDFCQFSKNSISSRWRRRCFVFCSSLHSV